MRKARILVSGIPAAILTEGSGSTGFTLAYEPGYDGPPVSLRLPVRPEPYSFPHFPAFFDGVLPEGLQLEALLRQAKIDRHDHFSQLVAVGQDLVGAVTVEPIDQENLDQGTAP